MMLKKESSDNKLKANISDLTRNKYQPRTHFDGAKLTELDSIEKMA